MQLRAAEKSTVMSGTKSEGEICKITGSLDDLLLTAIDETVKQIFKEAGAKVIYNYLENKYHLRIKEIASKPEDFSAGLEKLLSSAAPVIEKLILKNLYSKLHLTCEEKEGFEFSDYLEELRKWYR